MSKLNPAKQFVEYFVLFLMLLATSSKATVNEQIEIFLETPAPDQTITGVLFTRGWAVAPTGIVRVELYIDGNFLLEIPLGESRPEVGAMFPSFQSSDTSGFNIGLFYSRFANGPHTATVRAIDTNGDHKEASNSFTITRFDTSAPNNFLRDLSKINLSGATVGKMGDTIEIDGALIDGISYDVRLEFNVTLQGFAISKISPSQYMPPMFPFDGTWSGSAKPTTATDLYRDPCDTATFTMSIINHQISGTANTTLYGDYTLDGTVADNGQVSLGLAIGNDDVATFEGTLSGNSASGTYKEIYGCKGNWSATRN